MSNKFISIDGQLIRKGDISTVIRRGRNVIELYPKRIHGGEALHYMISSKNFNSAEEADQFIAWLGEVLGGVDVWEGS